MASKPKTKKRGLIAQILVKPCRYLPLLAVCVCLLLLVTLRCRPAPADTELKLQPELSKENGFHSDSTLLIDDAAAVALQARSRLMCWIPSTPGQLLNKVKALNDTWVQRCDAHLYFIERVNSSHPDVVSLPLPTGYHNLTAKSVGVLKYLYQHYLQDYDWFLKGDDDAYVVVENLRFLLSQYDPSSPVYLGHLYKQFHDAGYMSGGASYVMSKETLKKVVEEGFNKNKCRMSGGHEDVEIGKCVHAAGVGSHNSLDRFGREAFHPLSPSVHIVGPIPENQIPQDRFLMKSGKDCCSQLTISFHKLDPVLMRIFDHLLYRTSVYGRVLDLKAFDGFIKPEEVPPLKKVS